MSETTEPFDWSGKAVLVTGGAGFIGSHLVELLVDAGARVTVFDTFASGRRPTSAGSATRSICKSATSARSTGRPT